MTAASFRDELRGRAVAALRAANTLAGTSIYSNRTDPAGRDTLPIIAVYVPAEMKRSKGDASEPMFDCTLTLEIEARNGAKAIQDAERDMETLVQQVQDALLRSQSFLAAPLSDVGKIEIDTRIDGKSSDFTGIATLRFDIAYTDRYQPVIPDTLERMDIQVTPNPTDTPDPSADPIVANIYFPPGAPPPD